MNKKYIMSTSFSLILLAVLVLLPIFLFSQVFAERIECPGGTCIGTSQNDNIVGSPSPDDISGLEGIDLINGNEENDDIADGPGGDIISGGIEHDEISGGKEMTR